MKKRNVTAHGGGVCVLALVEVCLTDPALLV